MCIHLYHSLSSYSIRCRPSASIDVILNWIHVSVYMYIYSILCLKYKYIHEYTPNFHFHFGICLLPLNYYYLRMPFCCIYIYIRSYKWRLANEIGSVSSFYVFICLFFSLSLTLFLSGLLLVSFFVLTYFIIEPIII